MFYKEKKVMLWQSEQWHVYKANDTVWTIEVPIDLDWSWTCILQYYSLLYTCRFSVICNMYLSFEKNCEFEEEVTLESSLNNIITKIQDRKII